MLLNRLMEHKNQLHDMVAKFQANPVMPDDMNTFVDLQLVHKLAHGECHSLTLALHDFTGLPIVLLVDDSGEPLHSYVQHESHSIDGYLLSDEERTVAFYKCLGEKLGHSGAHPIMVTRNLFLNHFKSICTPQREMLAYFDSLMNLNGIDYSASNQFHRKAS